MYLYDSSTSGVLRRISTGFKPNIAPSVRIMAVSILSLIVCATAILRPSVSLAPKYLAITREIPLPKPKVMLINSPYMVYQY